MNEVLNKDAFDVWWEWANKNRENDMAMIAAEIHDAVMMLTEEERRDRATALVILATWPMPAAWDERR